MLTQTWGRGWCCPSPGLVAGVLTSLACCLACKVCLEGLSKGAVESCPPSCSPGHDPSCWTPFLSCSGAQTLLDGGASGASGAASVILPPGKLRPGAAGPGLLGRYPGTEGHSCGCCVPPPRCQCLAQYV